MLNFHLSSKPPSYWRMPFQSVGRPRHLSCLKFSRFLVILVYIWHKVVIIQDVKLKRRFSPGRESCLIIKGGITVASLHAPIQRNIKYRHMARRSIYDTRWSEHPPSPICRYEWRPRGTALLPRYKVFI